MHMPNDIAAASDLPLGGWTPELRVRFLDVLAEKGNVRLAAARCGLSAQSAYKLRRRDGLFARAWAAALLLAREHALQVLADRALDGVEEPVFYRGEQVGTRRRYDNRLLLAHLARLDTGKRVADRSGKALDAERFDEMLALIAGEAVPDGIDGGDDGIPCSRKAHTDAAVFAAEAEQELSLPPASDADEKDERDATIEAACSEARIWAELVWDEWFDRACRRVDAIELSPQDSVNSVNRVSSSLSGEGGADLADAAAAPANELGQG